MNYELCFVIVGTIFIISAMLVGLWKHRDESSDIDEDW